MISFFIQTDRNSVVLRKKRRDAETAAQRVRPTGPNSTSGGKKSDRDPGISAGSCRDSSLRDSEQPTKSNALPQILRTVGPASCISVLRMTY